MSDKNLLTQENYSEKVFRFQNRQAGISVIFDPDDEVYTYNAYCLEIELMKELFTSEFDYLEDALELINSEFGTWDLVSVAQDKSGCGNCIAK